MIISSTVDSPQYSPDTRFKAAGWLSILGIFLACVDIVIVIFYSSNPVLKPLVLFRIPLVILRVSFAIFVLVQFKRLLNERYDLHKANVIITAMIILEIVWGAYNIVFMPLVELSPLKFLGIFQIAFAVLFLISYGILGIVLGVYLLGVREDPSGLFRIYVILSIVASSCLATVVLAPIAILLGLVETVILAILFFRAAEAEPQVEFV
jgi:hypothetical protein